MVFFLAKCDALQQSQRGFPEFPGDSGGWGLRTCDEHVLHAPDYRGPFLDCGAAGEVGLVSMAGKQRKAIELDSGDMKTLKVDNLDRVITCKGNEQAVTELALPTYAQACQAVVIEQQGSGGQVASYEARGHVVERPKPIINNQNLSPDVESLDWQFVEDHTQNEILSCIICLDVLVSPHQITCCGEYVCKKCIDSHLQREAVVRKDKKPRCFNCRKTEFRLIENSDLKKSIGKLSVYCLYRKSGCMWSGQLQNSEAHLRECLFCPIDCPNGCKYGRIDRRNFSKHLAECPLQSMECPYKCIGCKMEDSFPRKEIQVHSNKEIHHHLVMLAKSNIGQYEECDITLATLRSSHDEMVKEKTERIQSQKQVLTSLEQTIKSLEANLLGLTQKISTLKETEDTNRARCIAELNKKGEEARKLQHVSQETLAEIQVLPVPQKTTNYYPPVTFTIDNFNSRKSLNEQWFSPPFYTHFGGYKMCLSVYPNGYEEAQGNHISVFFHMMSGEFDDHLEWPFPGAIINVSALSQRSIIVRGVVGSRGNFGAEIVLIGQNTQECRSRVYSGSYGPGYGQRKYIPHCFLNQYLTGDLFKLVIYHFQFLPL